MTVATTSLIASTTCLKVLTQSLAAGGFDRFAGCIILLGDVNGDCRALRSDDTVGDCADEITNPIEA